MDIRTWEATVVKIPFVNKRGQTMEKMAELYLRKEGKDYYIKFMEGDVSPDELEKYIGQTVSFEISLRKGNWDTENSNTYQQSRVGEYVVVHRIIQ